MKQEQKMSFRELHEQMEKPTPIWKHNDLAVAVRYVGSLTVANTIVIILLHTILG